jgi:hypothetical protein
MQPDADETLKLFDDLFDYHEAQVFPGEEEPEDYGDDDQGNYPDDWVCFMEDFTGAPGKFLRDSGLPGADKFETERIAASCLYDLASGSPTVCLAMLAGVCAQRCPEDTLRQSLQVVLPGQDDAMLATRDLNLRLAILGFYATYASSASKDPSPSDGAVVAKGDRRAKRGYVQSLAVRPCRAVPCRAIYLAWQRHMV